MPKSPENMTPEERLARIRTLERQVERLKLTASHREELIEAQQKFADESWAEVHRCHELLTLRAKLRDDLAVPDFACGCRVQLTMKRGRPGEVKEDGRIGVVIRVHDTVESLRLVCIDDFSTMWLSIKDLRKL